MLLEGKIALVTGAAQGLGRADALALAAEGADVAVADLNLAGAEEVAEEARAMGRRALAFKLDVSDYEQVGEVVAKVKEQWGSIQILVNNAAKMDTMAQMTNMTKEMWDKDLSVNLTGAFNVTKHVWDDMVANKFGRIVNMSSVAGLMGGFGQTVYSAAKAGIVGFTKSLALEGARHNIRVNCIAPSIIRTPAFERLPEKYQQRMVDRIPMKQVGDPADVGNLVVFLVSEKSGFITGQVIGITGGLDLFVF